jgi:HSP20 family protein
MVMSRWDPFNEALTLRDAMSRLVEQAVLQPGSEADGRTTRGALSLPIDVIESPTAYAVKASLPGVKPEDVDVQIQQEQLTISGVYKEEEREPQGTEAQSRYHIRERRQGRFYRAISLPGGVNAGKTTAAFEHGVLTVNVPKAEEAKPRRVAIQVDGAAQPGSQSATAAAEKKV